MTRTRCHRPLFCYALVAVVVLAGVPGEREACGGGPLMVERGRPYRWNTAVPVTISPDQGPLGSISNGVATDMARSAVEEWDGVPTATLEVELGAPLPEDIEGLGEDALWNYVTRKDGRNPLIFDRTGSIIDALFGPGSGVLGAAGPSLVIPSSRTIIKGFAIFNGRGKDEKDIPTMQAVMTHELGHLLNLDHSQVNGARIGMRIPGFDGAPRVQDVETMYPLLIPSISVPHPMSTLHKDDRAAFSALYPTPGFAVDTATVTGIVFDFDGATRLQGVNVVARAVDQPFENAVSYISGTLARDEPQFAASLPFVGAFELAGLTPGIAYKIYIEEVEEDFYKDIPEEDPLSPPRDLDPSRRGAFLEFYSGADEDTADPPDDPFAGVEIVLQAGSVLENADVLFNGVLPRVFAVDPPSGPYTQSQEVVVSGANLDTAVSVVLIGPESFSLRNFEVLDPSRLLVQVPANVLPGDYSVVVTTAKGGNDPGPELYRVTEPLPVVVSMTPDTLVNDRVRTLTAEGSHLLGAESAELVSTGLTPVPLGVLRVLSAGEVELQVPAGAFPGEYRVVVSNTAGESPPSEDAITVSELAPVLSGEVVPPSGGNSGTRNINILGENLTGTSAVELIKLPDEDPPVSGAGAEVEPGVPVLVRSASLNSVQVAVPGGLAPGSYLVALTNSAGSTEGPSTYEVFASSGGGGGCAADCRGGRSPGADPVLFLLILLVAAALRRRKSHTRRTRETGPT